MGGAGCGLPRGLTSVALPPSLRKARAHSGSDGRPSTGSIQALFPALRSPRHDRSVPSALPRCFVTLRLLGRCVRSSLASIASRTLNKRYRSLDRVTDVLSFPADPHPFHDRSSARVLGDIVIATGVAKRQARSFGVSVDMEIRRLTLHGLLHLMGYDHETDTGQMSKLERRLLRIGGLEDLSA